MINPDTPHCKPMTDHSESQSCPPMCLGFYFISYQHSACSHVPLSQEQFSLPKSDCSTKIDPLLSIRILPNVDVYNYFIYWEIIFFSDNFTSYLAWQYTVSVFNLPHFSMKNNTTVLPFYFVPRNWDLFWSWMENTEKSPTFCINIYFLKRQFGEI